MIYVVLLLLSLGSIITFPPYWVHWVITNPGLSFMYTLRLKYPGNMFFIFLKRLFVERLTVFYMIPEWYFREALQSTFNRILGYQKLDSSFETGDDATVIFLCFDYFFVCRFYWSILATKM